MGNRSSFPWYGNERNYGEATWIITTGIVSGDTIVSIEG